MKKQISARERFRAVFEHNTAELDRLPMLSLSTPPQGLFYQEWAKMMDSEQIPDDYVRLTYFGDMTIKKFICSEWENMGLNYPTGWPNIPLPDDHPMWGPYDKSKVKITIGPHGTTTATGTEMHGVEYSWYIDGYFSRQKQADGTIIEPHEVREQFYAKYGHPWDEKYAPSDAQKKHFKERLKWYEQNYNNFSDSGFSDFALMCSAGGLFEAVWEGMGSGQPTVSIMAKKYPGQLQAWLHEVKEWVLKNVKLQFELADEADAQIDFVWFWDDSGQKARSLINPELHKKYWVPLYKEITDYIHKKGGFCIIHSCGFGESLVENWIEGGIDAWQTIERAALNDPARIRQKVGNKLIMIGAIDASNVVSFSDSTQEIEEHVKTTIRDAVYTPEDACYVPGFTHDLLDPPVRNVRAAVDAMLKYGTIESLKTLKKS
jgi:hypothetical protein